MHRQNLLNRRAVLAAGLALPWTAPGAGADVPSGPSPLKAVPAAQSPIATQAALLGVARAGPRLVAVGDHGVVLLSDDGGVTFRQAQRVPVSSLLTGVAFADDRHGWAVGHWGAILATSDGGESWGLQRLMPDEDRPLFAVHFFDARQGVAVGLWSLVLRTADGGRTWVQQAVSPPPGSKKADANLLSLFADAQGGLYATAERGLVLHSTDQGRSWRYITTGYKGSLWTGMALPEGRVLVGGQRGTLLLSTDGGTRWDTVPLKSSSSITTLSASGGELLVAGLDGLLATSLDGGTTFVPLPSDGAPSFTAAVSLAPSRWLLLSRRGVLPALRAPAIK